MKSGIISLTIFATTFSPAFAFAKEHENKANKGQENFCAKISTLAQKLEERVANNQSKLDKVRTERDHSLNTKKSDSQAKVVENRSKNDEKQALRYEATLGKAATGTQKIALAAFKTTLDQAITLRRQAVDAAQAAFQSSTKKVVADRKAQIDLALTTYKAAVITAKNKAAADCATVDAKIVKTNLETALKTAQIAFKNARTEAMKVGPEVKGFTETRKTAVTLAVTTFKTTMDKAIQDLKVAFGKTTATTTTTSSTNQ